MAAGLLQARGVEQITAVTDHVVFAAMAELGSEDRAKLGCR